jgi:hypothetical protein
MMYMVAPMMGVGLFTMAKGGMMTAAGSLVGHVLYGSILSAIAGAPEMTRAAA